MDSVSAKVKFLTADFVEIKKDSSNDLISHTTHAGNFLDHIGHMITSLFFNK